MKLVDNWRDVLRFGASIRAAVIVSFFVGAQAALPDILDALSFLSPVWRAVLVMTVTAAALIGSRLIDQPKVREHRNARAQ